MPRNSRLRVTTRSWPVPRPRHGARKPTACIHTATRRATPAAQTPRTWHGTPMRTAPTCSPT
ncbi:hypothetical protein CUU80_09455 [Bifidobacterium scaligerum]|uniref:Uncharacterized protein n=1 Tax=Bifidobacterium scaligerum TaxID=2052656 RepID=A0A2M9HNK6_9BIFI|nr:hypothetical protein CUU80_09455 [Bifidobacterium scaligerum]